MLESDLKEKSIKEIIDYADVLYRQGNDEKKKALKIYLLALDKVPNKQDGDKPYVLRGIIRKRIWDCEKSIHGNEIFFSESGQDKIIKDSFFKDQKDGFFVEIGAFDGLEGSNCYHFEKFMNWKGIAIEASPTQFKKLQQNRNCHLHNVALSSIKKGVEFYEVIECFTQMSGINNVNYQNSYDRIINKSNSKINKININATTFEDLIPNSQVIDYISIDIEGNELDVLSSIDFSKYKIKVILLENNIPQELNYLKFFLEKNFSYFDRVGMDEIYYNNNYYNL
jgi:FkbM family methyltransferase